MNASGHFGFKLLEVIFILFLSIAIFFKAPTIEKTLMPVTKDFTINKVLKVEGGIEVEGTLFKQRSCEFKDLITYAKTDSMKVREPVDHEFREPYKISTRTIDKKEKGQRWGPWAIFIPGDFEEARIEFYTIHNCHSFYNLHSKIASFQVSHINDQLTWIQ